MKSGKTIETAQRALEVLKEIMNKSMSVEEILDMLSLNQDIGIVYTKEAIYKYFNTFKTIGTKINKNKGTYSVEKSFLKTDFSDEDKFAINFIENYVNALQNSQYKDLFYNIKTLISKSCSDISSNILPVDLEKIININKKYQPFSELIEKIGNACIKKETLIINYKISKDEIIKYTIVPDKIVFKKGYLILYAFNRNIFEYSDFFIENILSFEFSPKYGETNFYVKYIVFKVTNELAKNYHLKKNEILRDEGEDYLILANKGQNLKEFARRLFRYGENCEMLYPVECRAYMKEKIEKSLALYKN